MATRNILTTLKAEHDELRDLFAQMEVTTDRALKKRGELLEKMKQGLLPHAKWEEIVFYPAFRERADRDGLKTLAEAIQEHKAVEQTVLPDVEAAQVGTPEFAGRVQVFGELISHHATEEENTMFKMARKMFSAAELAQFDLDYAEWKKSTSGVNTVAGARVKAALTSLVR